MPPKIARFVAGWYQIDVDGRVVAFTVALALGAALIFGLMPAFQASRPKLAESLKEGGRSTTVGAGRLRLRRGLVVAEMALALPLLVASALSVLTVQRFLYGPQGYEPEPPADDAAGAGAGPLRRRGRVPQIRDRRRRPPAPDRPASRQPRRSTSCRPAATTAAAAIEIEGRPNQDPANPPQVDYRVATPDVFAVLQIPILRGRGFSDCGSRRTRNRSPSSRSRWRSATFRTVDPIGRRIRIGTNGPWLTIVGVSGDVIHDWFARRNYPTLYRPLAAGADAGDGAAGENGRRARRGGGGGARGRAGPSIRRRRCST